MPYPSRVVGEILNQVVLDVKDRLQKARQTAQAERRRAISQRITRELEGVKDLIDREREDEALKKLKTLADQAKDSADPVGLTRRIQKLRIEAQDRIAGRRIEVRMFSDRLEIISPGGLPGYITIENILKEHYSRNPRIVNGLMQWGYIEELGLGMDRIFESLARNGQPPPKLDSTPYRFMLVMYNVRKPVLLPEWEKSMNERQLRALQYLQEHGRITNREYHKLCPHVSSETLRLDLVDLVERGILLKIGEKKGTYYILK
jgi:ATP-dependent DNA helicase RecG